MIDKQALVGVIEQSIKESDMFLVDVAVTKDNVITVELDSYSSISIDECAALTRAIEAEFDRDVEDYELEVGSAGLTSPFRVKAQYEKNKGNEVEVLTCDGRKLKGVLKDVLDDKFVLTTTKKVKPEGAKKPVMVEEDEAFEYDKVKYTKYLIQFK